MAREVVEPTITPGAGGALGGDIEQHPAFGMIGASRVSTTPGAVLFDSEIRHSRVVTIKIETADRRRDLNRDWIHGDKQIIEVAMSEAQWASFVSSMNSGGVPCTLEYTREDGYLPGMPFAPRMQESMAEVKGAAEKAVERIQTSFKAVEEAFESNAGKKVLRERIRDLHFAIAHVPANMEFAASSLTEHAENVVQKAKVDIEAMVQAHAKQLKLDPSEVTGLAQLGAGEEDDAPRR